MPTQQDSSTTWQIHEHGELVFEMQTGSKTWEIDRDDYRDDYDRVDEESFRRAVADELAALENIGERLGRGFTVLPIRVETSPGSGRYFTKAWRFQDAFVPAAKWRVDEQDEVQEEVAA